MVERVVVVAPRGFCAGVVRAVETVEQALATYGRPIYVRRAIVHNPHVVRRLAAAGAIFVQELAEVPAGAVVVFSAHGVAKAVPDEARQRGLRSIDATCPLVSKVHQEVQRFAAGGFDVILVGHAGHDEVIGTLGQLAGAIHLVQRVEDVADVVVRDVNRVACVTQTTLSPYDVAPVLDALHRRFPRLAQPRVEDICFATRNRQDAVRWLAQQVDVVLVFGHESSSNSRRLQEVAQQAGACAYLLDEIARLDPAWLRGCASVGLTAGASTPESVVEEAVRFFRRSGASVEDVTLQQEQVVFAMPAA